MSGQPTVRTIRLYCDGELSDAEARSFEQRMEQDPRLSGRVEFEQRLKERVDQVLRAGSPPVPTELADGMRQTLTRESADVAGGIDGEATPETADRAWWSNPRRANLFAVAACLALVAGAVLFGILGPQIDTLRMSPTTSVTAEAAAAVAGEHVKATTGLPRMTQESSYRTPDDARRGLVEQLGVVPAIFDLREIGYEFVAGNTCDVPGCERGCHLVYRTSRGQPGIVTLHVVPDRGQIDVRHDASEGKLPLETGFIPQGPSCEKDVLVWNHEGFTYLLVACHSSDVTKVARHVQETLRGLPAPPRR
ncbi:MAG: anti-sigma factor family protein [Planctomycetota bacterium]|jgi:anti-sigma factor RsiW